MTATRSETPRANGSTIINLQGPRVTARFSTLGGQLLRYGIAGEPPLLWENEAADYDTPSAIREGMPLCGPWFGDLKRNPAEVQQIWGAGSSQPAHGLFRQALWEEVPPQELASGPETIDIGFRYHLQQPGLPALIAEVHYQLEPDLVVTWFIRLAGKTGPAPQPPASSRGVPITLALHTYFAVSHLEHVSIRGLDGYSYFDSADGWAVKNQGDPFTISGEVDRVFESAPLLIAFEDRDWGRMVELQAEGLDSAVVWNPGPEKASALSQFNDGAYHHMLCIENAALLSRALSILPGHPARAQLRIRTRSL